MKLKSPNTLLLIADISGYTQFMRQHAISMSHAKQIVVRLLRTLMQTARPPLKVAELEGDAVFFYARARSGDMRQVAGEVKAQILDLFSSFDKELAAINSVTTCTCDACVQAKDLHLKQVVHLGDCELEKIEQFEKLFGLDVIVIHRLLKNSVPSNEYVLMTNPVFSYFKDFFGLKPQRYTEELEGVGEVETLVFYPKELEAEQPLSAPRRLEAVPTFRRKLAWRLEITIKTVRDLLGLGKYEGTFQHIPS